MKHGALFCLLGLLMAAMPWLYGGGWFWLLLWPAMNLLVLGIAYLRRDSLVFGKRSDGTLDPVRVIVLLPYLLFTWAVWHGCRLLPEPAAQRINERLTVGRRLVGNERPAGITTILDMTSEFAEPASVRKGVRYVNLPTLDACAPPCDALVAAIRDLRPDEHVFIHCAQGHGRTGLAALALLLRRGEVDDIGAGLSLLRSIRPGIGLSADQRACLEQCLPQLRS
jgi:protein-tyrosine phosphatase